MMPNFIMHDCVVKTYGYVFSSFEGYLKFGFNREEGGVVYREWAPAAQ